MFKHRHIYNVLSRPTPLASRARIWPMPQHRGIQAAAVQAEDIARSRNHCLEQLRRYDHDSYLLRHFLPAASQDLFLAARALNLELVRIPESVSNPALGRFRMQFWRDALAAVFASEPSREPISLLLHSALSDLAARSPSSDPTSVQSSIGGPSASSIKFWLTRLITTREKHLENPPFPTLADLERYAENTYSSLFYCTPAALGLRSMHLDHLVSHVGKAAGIAAVLRGIPILSATRGGAAGGAAPAVLLPLETMADVGVREEDIFRYGPRAEGLQEAVFRVATRANDHLITARTMLGNVRAGKDVGHAFEHEGEGEMVYPGGKGETVDEGTKREVKAGFDALLEAVPVQDYLKRLEAADFDVYKVKNPWKTAWNLWWAQKRKVI